MGYAEEIAMEIDLENGLVLHNRYEILHLLGQGGNGTTYAARDRQTQQTVALKALSLRGLKDWKQLDLFEREAKVLKNLNHPGIPRYVDGFQIQTDQDQVFYLVQELAEGQSLAVLVESGWHADEGEVQRIALELLEILVYLHSLKPPIVHRDLKPQNVIRRGDGRIFLVDFGAVQAVYQDALRSSSTVVGTYGYMAPEQFRGAASPASDLYALGATLLFLLTHQSPAKLPQERLKIQFRQVVDLSDEFADWLEGILEPVDEDRMGSAKLAIAYLLNPLLNPLPNSQSSLTSSPPQRSNLLQPSNSSIKLQRSFNRLSLDIPPSGLRGELLALGGFALFWNGFIFFWTFMSVAMGAPIIFSLFSIPFWVVGIGMLSMVVSGLFGQVSLTVNASHYRFCWQLWHWRRERQGPTRDLYQVNLRTRYSQNDRPVQAIAIAAGADMLQFGTMLSDLEKAWLVQELSRFLDDIKVDRR